MRGNDTHVEKLIKKEKNAKHSIKTNYLCYSATIDRDTVARKR